MKRVVWSKLSAAERLEVLKRPEQRSDERLRADVAAIVEDVRKRGWRGLCDIAEQIDGAAPSALDVAPPALAARKLLSADQLRALEFAAERIRIFHEASRPSDFAIETAPGLIVRRTWRAIERVGLYVPGGKTPLFSSLLMLAIPARVAGVAEIVAVTPPRSDGTLDPLVALAAELSGIDRMWTIGGAQAIAALALGAGEIPQVDKICGPGNAWVAEAKRLVAGLPGGPAIDMPAGPSELMVIADENAKGLLVAADLLSQAEHDPQAQVLLVTTATALADVVEAEVERRVTALPRARIAAASLRNARFILVNDLVEAVEVANLYAPEHLSLAVSSPDALIPDIRNAGAVFAGTFAAETFGDYLAGPSHVLPTDGAARAWSGVSVQTFLKAMSVQTVTCDAARRIAGPAATLARMEGLEAHAFAADARLEIAA